MKLYHGSYLDIEKIDLEKSLKGKDFGKGFYLSADLQQAQNIAQIRSLSLNTNPVVNVYEIEDAIFEQSELKVKQFLKYSEEWAEFVLANRKNLSDEPIHDYDIVIGPIANDRVGLQIRKFMDGEIDMNEFLNRLKFMKGVTIQYFFGTKKAISFLKKRESIK